MKHQRMHSGAPVITAVVDRALALGFDLEVAGGEGLVVERSDDLREILQAIARMEYVRLTVLEPRPSGRRIGTLIHMPREKNSAETLARIDCHGDAALAVMEDIAHTSEQWH